MGKSFKNVGSRLILTLAAALTLVLITAFPTKAASKPSPITELKQIDEHAFVVEKDGLNIMGRFEKHL